MVKKSIVSTVIFTLIVINLIMWPTLFSHFNEGNAEVSREDSIGVDDEVVGVGADLDLEEEVDSELSGEVDGIEDEKDGDESSVSTSEKKEFKILRIE